MKPTYISWAPYCSRSDHTARELGGTSHMVYWRSLGSRVSTIWLKYLGQAFSTFRILSAERPDVVFVMSPPVFAVLAVWLWCRLHGVPYVVDTHTASFAHPRAKHPRWLHAALWRRAATSIVTNEHLADRLRALGAHATIVTDVPIEYAVTDAFQPDGAFTVAVVCSFNDDEPIAEIMNAAGRLDGIRFYMTGKPKSRLPVTPPNVTMCGFLSTEAYGSLLTNSHAVMTLTTRDHTMLRGAYEAVYQGTPVIVSDWPVLRRAFGRGAVHVDNTVNGIAAGIEEMRAHHTDYKAEVLLLREQKHTEWQRAKSALLTRLQATETK